MKSKLMILLLIFGWVNSFSQSVPNTTTFSLQDVIDVVNPTTYDLLDCFADVNAAYFDATYGSKTMSPKTLLGFRNYTVQTCPDIGDSYQDGVVAYIYVSGDPGYVAGECHGIITTTTTIGYYVWYDGSCDWYEFYSTGAALGTGLTNTNTIYAALSGCYYNIWAGEVCYNYSTTNYSDWYLPSRDEAKKIWDSRALLGGNSLYPIWTSTETELQGAYEIMADGTAFNTNKSSSLLVRPIRYF